MLEYKVIVHRRVHKFLLDIKNENIKNMILSVISKLEKYPMVMKNMDVEKIKGLDRTFRIRVGRYRIIFYVDKAERTIYVTHVETRKKAYKKF